MDQILVVLDDSDASIDLLREAGEIAAAVGVPILLYALVDEDSDERTIEHMWNRIRRGSDEERPSTRQEVAKAFAERIGQQTLGDTPVEYRARGELLTDRSRSDRIIEVAEANECDHVFISGTRRSPTGKALFGDTTQSVILHFDGIVTVASN